jgi:starch synthase
MVTKAFLIRRRVKVETALTFQLLLAASEVVGFAKTGGLADVAGALPRALARRGHRCAIILPLYRCVRTGKVPLTPTPHQLSIPVGNKTVAGRLWQATLPDADVPVYLVDQPDYFDRDDPVQGRGLYQFTLPGGQKKDYGDNCERFVFFSRAVLEAVRLLDYWPDVLHANDWQTGLVPVYLRELYARHPEEVRRRYARIRTLFTIHNLAYQGLFWHWDMMLTGLDWSLFNHRQLEFYGMLSLLKGGIVFADVLSTVSPTYAREIQTPYFGVGMQGVLAERSRDLYGIVNGVDYDAWDPATDRAIAARYTSKTVREGKPRCKTALQERFRLPVRPATPLLGVVARLAEQKGIDLIAGAAEQLLQDDVQLVVLGDGDQVYQHMLTRLHERHPDKMGLYLGFDESLAHQIEAGADAFLMPSIYEPSGLNQLYSMRYGTVPVVRATGGLADTVVDCTPQTLSSDTATGFCFVPPTIDAFREAVHRALEMYRRQPDVWLQVMRCGMRQDWSWNRSAAEYEKLFERMTEEG